MFLLAQSIFVFNELNGFSIHLTYCSGSKRKTDEQDFVATALHLEEGDQSQMGRYNCCDNLELNLLAQCHKTFLTVYTYDGKAI